MAAHPGHAAASEDAEWCRLGAPQQELQLDFCLPTGQSFRWRKTGDNQYTGVIGSRLVCLRQEPDDVSFRVLARGGDTPASADAAVLRDYFNLDTRLTDLAPGWAARCSRFRDVSPYFPGARMLRQDPLECLFQFICSSNNHISRIHGMVERICSLYGTPLEPVAAPVSPEAVTVPVGLEPGYAAADAAAAAAGSAAPGLVLAGSGLEAPTAGARSVHEGSVSVPESGATTAAVAAPRSRRAAGRRQPGKPKEAAEEQQEDGAAAAPAAAGGAGKKLAAGGPAAGAGLSYYAFPTLEQLGRATEEELRAAGFGYRARFIVGTAAALRDKPGGGRKWLLALRQVGLEEAVEALTELPGIGPKVAACICLFSLDKHAAIPVDTHVWQIAVRYYCPQLAGKSLTKRIHGEVQRVFVERFGGYAGWAHNTLFISELASQQHRLPERLRQAKKGPGSGARRGRGKQAGGEATSEEEDGEAEEVRTGGPGGKQGAAAAAEAAAAAAAAAAASDCSPCTSTFRSSSDGSETSDEEGGGRPAGRRRRGGDGGGGGLGAAKTRRRAKGKGDQDDGGERNPQEDEEEGSGQKTKQKQRKRRPAQPRETRPDVDEGNWEGQEPEGTQQPRTPPRGGSGRGVKRREPAEAAAGAATAVAPGKRPGGHRSGSGGSSGGRRDEVAVALDYGVADFDDLAT